jgi:hypothetical protein
VLFGIQHVGGKSMAERVHPEAVGPYALEQPMYGSLNGAGGKSLSPATHEHRTPVASGVPNDRISMLKVAPERRYRSGPDRHDPLLATLASDLQLIGEQIEIFQIRSAQLGKSNSRGIEQLQDCEIPGRKQLVRLGL